MKKLLLHSFYFLYLPYLISTTLVYDLGVDLVILLHVHKK